MAVFNIEKLKETIINLVESKIELKKIQIQEKVEGTIAESLIDLLGFLLILLIIIFSSILLAIGINYQLESQFWGFIIILGIYIAIFLGFIYFKETLKIKIGKKIGKKIDKQFRNKINNN